MSHSFNPRAVLFDFDGVILDTEWPIYETWRDLFLEHGQELTLETYVQCIGSDFDTWSPETYLESLTGLNFDWKTRPATSSSEKKSANSMRFPESANPWPISNNKTSPAPSSPAPTIIGSAAGSSTSGSLPVSKPSFAKVTPQKSNPLPTFTSRRSDG